MYGSRHKVVTEYVYTYQTSEYTCRAMDCNFAASDIITPGRALQRSTYLLLLYTKMEPLGWGGLEYPSPYATADEQKGHHRITYSVR